MTMFGSSEPSQCDYWFLGNCLLVALLHSSGCSSQEFQALEPTSEPPADSGAGGSPDSSVGDGQAEDALSEDTNGNTSDAALAPVRLGVIPTAGGGGEAGVTVIDTTQADLDVLAAGSRAISVIRRWDTLFDESGQSASTRWNEIGQSANLYRNADCGVLLTLAIVDRTLDARPEKLQVEWDAPPVLEAVEKLIDRSFEVFAEELLYLGIGNEVDRWLNTATNDEQVGFVNLATHAMNYARQHPSRPTQLEVGISVTFQGAVSNEMAALTQLVDSSDVVVVSYHPLDTQYQARPPSTAAGDLDALVESMASDGGERSLILQEVAYPSSSEVGSSPQNQETFFNSFFQALLARSERFPFVSVYSLNDQNSEHCLEEAAAFGQAGNSSFISARCSLGLRSVDTEAKPAWFSVLNGLATFALP